MFWNPGCGGGSGTSLPVCRAPVHFTPYNHFSGLGRSALDSETHTSGCL